MSKIISKLFIFLFLMLFSFSVFATPSITVKSNLTNDPTPIVTGAFDLNGVSADANFIIIINTVEYKSIDTNVDVNYDTNTWQLNALGLEEGNYDVNAIMRIDNNFYFDITTNEVEIDLTKPDVEIIFNNNFQDEEQPLELNIGETMLVRFLFSEKVTDFNNSDINLEAANGTLTPVDTNNDINFLATFTPDLNIYAIDNDIRIYLTDVFDLAGNDGNVNYRESDDFNINTLILFDAPTNYNVNFNAEYVNDANKNAISFTMSYPDYNADIDTNYLAIITDSNSSTVTNSGIMNEATKRLDGIQLGGLLDGNLVLTLKLTNLAGDGDDVNDLILKDTNFPIIDVNNVDTNQTVTVTPIITETGSGIATYAWTADPEGVTFSADDANVTDINASTDGNYTITLTVTDVAGNAQATEFSFVWDTTEPEIEDINNIFTNETVTVEAIATDSGSGIASYLWSTPDENVTIATSDANTTDINASVDGNYTIILTVIDNVGNSADTNFLFTWDTMTPALTEISLDDRFNLYLIFSENITWDNNKMDTLSKIEINGANPSAASDPDLNPSTVLLLSFDDYLITDINTFTIDANAFTDLSGNLLPDINADYLDENTTINDHAFPFSYVDTNINDENNLRVYITEPLAYYEEGLRGYTQLSDLNDLTTYYEISADINSDLFSATYNDDVNGYYIDFVTTDSNDGATIILDAENYPLFDAAENPEAEANPYTPIHLQLDNGNWLFRRIVSAGDTVIDFEPDDSSYSIIIPSNINSEQQIDLNLSGILSDDNSLVVPNGEDFFLERQTAGPKYSVTIPAGTTITGANGWDGLITLPIITSNLTVPSATTNITINVGSSYGLTFDKAVKILIGGMAGKRAAYKNGSTVTTISACTAGQIANPDSLTANTGNCYTDNGTDLIIWTKHFTDFAAYTPTEEDDDDSPGGGSDDDEEEDEDEASCSDIDITTTSITIYSDSTSTKSIALINDSEDFDFEIEDITITEATGIDVSIVDEPEDVASEDSEYLKIELETDEFSSATTKTIELEIEGVFDDDDETDCSIDQDISVRIQLVSADEEGEEPEVVEADTNATTYNGNTSDDGAIDGTTDDSGANAISDKTEQSVTPTKKKSNDWLFWLLDLSIVVVIIALVLIIKKKKDPRRSRL